jgi:hypothetical protein
MFSPVVACVRTAESGTRDMDKVFSERSSRSVNGAILVDVVGRRHGRCSKE